MYENAGDRWCMDQVFAVMQVMQKIFGINKKLFMTFNIKVQRKLVIERQKMHKGVDKNAAEYVKDLR